MKRIGVLVSGGGTNLQALFDSSVLKSGEIVTVVSSKEGAYALERAKNHNVPGVAICRKDFADADAYDKAIADHMRAAKVDLIVMAGFLSIVGKNVLDVCPIINIHPSLIPSFCGKGFYGLHVHERVLEYGVKVTGATVHFVNGEVDGGAIILQKSVMVEPGDTPEILQKRVMQQAEWQILPEAVELFCADKLEINGRQVWRTE